MLRALAFVVAVVLSISVARSAAATEIVIAIRYLQAQGTSHAHLYLYRDDGKLLRQLTKDDSGQDFDPIFAPDGSTIAFSREEPGGRTEFWSVTPLGGDLRRLDAAPDWYGTSRTSPFFTNFDPELQSNPDPTPPSDAANGGAEPPRTYRAPDESCEIVVRRLTSDEDDAINGLGTGKHFLLRDPKAKREVEMGTLPGFEGLYDVLATKGEARRVFLFEGPLRVAFFALHLDSTAGDTTYALDLTGPRIVRLSPNWATPVPLPDEAAFLTLTDNRYVPIPGSKKTANCSFVERWDAKFNKVRYAREGSAAICYGASLYRAGMNPATINLRRNAD